VCSCGGECLKYAHENGCPWDEIKCMDVARDGYGCRTYLLETGCVYRLGLFTSLNPKVSIAMNTVENIQESIPQDAYRVARRHLEELQAYASPRKGVYDDPLMCTLGLRDLVRSVMSALDEVVETIPTGAYVTLANALKQIHDYDVHYDDLFYDDGHEGDWDDSAWFDEQIF